MCSYQLINWLINLPSNQWQYLCCTEYVCKQCTVANFLLYGGLSCPSFIIVQLWLDNLPPGQFPLLQRIPSGKGLGLSLGRVRIVQGGIFQDGSCPRIGVALWKIVWGKFALCNYLWTLFSIVCTDIINLSILYFPECIFVISLY